MNDNSEYTLLDKFDLHSGKIACDLFEQRRIDFKVETDDTLIRDMKPWQSLWGGTYGSGVTVNIYVLTTTLEQCITILNEHEK